MGSMPMYVPDFKNVVMPAIVAALDEWKADAEKSRACSQRGAVAAAVAGRVGRGGP